MLQLLLFLVGCGGCAPDAPDPGAPLQDKPDIVMIVLDSVRADHLSLYGYARPTSPRLDAWAADALVFESAYTSATTTRASVATLLTSTPPAQHGLFQPGDVPNRPSKPLQGALTAEGYRTHAVVASRALTPATNFFMRGFETFDHSAVDDKSASRGQDVTSKEVTDAAIAAWQGRSTEPLFLFVHYHDPSALYGKHDGYDFGDRPIDRYDSELAWVDGQLGRLLDAVGDEALVIVTASHGEAFEEHGAKRHGSTLYQEEVHVPLVVQVPGLEAERFEQITRLVDLAPALVELGGMAPVESFSGRSWGKSRFGKLALGKRFVQLETRGEKDLRGVVRGRYKLIEDRLTHTQTLYDLRVDPGETQDRVADPAYRSALSDLRSHLP